MKILLIIDGMHPRSGGPPAVVAGSAIALTDRGHDVTVLTTAHRGDEPVVRQVWQAMIDHGVRIVFCAPEGLAGLITTSRQAALLRAEITAADVLHLHGLWNPILQICGRIAAQLSRPYLISVHGVLDQRAMRRLWFKWIKKRVAIEMFGIRGLLNRASAVVFGSEAEATQSWMPTRAMHTIFIPNGVATPFGTGNPTAEEIEILHAVAPAQQGWERTLLCRSRIHPEKGIDMLVAAFDRVAANYPGLGLLIAGMTQDADYQRRIEHMISASSVGDRIALTTELTGPKSLFLYRAADVFVMPSIAEGFSMALIEGLASGRPLLITRYCHMQDVETHGAGLVVDPTVDAIADGLRAIAALSDGELTAMGQRSRQLFIDRYTWDHVAAMLESAYAASRTKSPDGAT